MKVNLTLETTSQDKLIGDYIYCVSDLTGLNIESYTVIYKLYNFYKSNNYNMSLSLEDFILLDKELINIQNKYRCLYTCISVIESNNKTDSFEKFTLISELTTNALKLSINKEVNVYTRTNLELLAINTYKINNPNTLDCRETQHCFITSLLCDKKHLEQLRLTPCFNYKWEIHKGNFCYESLYEILQQPTGYHRREYVCLTPQLLNKYIFIYPKLIKFIKYLKRSPRWWFVWSEGQFKDSFNPKELKDLNWYIYCLQSKPRTNVRKVTASRYKKGKVHK